MKLTNIHVYYLPTCSQGSTRSLVTLLAISMLRRSPDSGPLKKKMVYSSTKDAVQKKFVGVGIVFEAHDKADLSYEDMAAEIEKKA